MEEVGPVEILRPDRHDVLVDQAKPPIARQQRRDRHQSKRAHRLGCANHFARRIVVAHESFGREARMNQQDVTGLRRHFTTHLKWA
jgi:predicted transcriptional regulator